MACYDTTQRYFFFFIKIEREFTATGKVTMSKPREQSVKELTFRCTTYLTYEQAATGCQRGIIISRYWQNSSWQEPKPKWDSSVQFCTISISFLILPVTHSCPPSLLQVCASPLAFHTASDFCVVELLFLFVPLSPYHTP